MNKKRLPYEEGTWFAVPLRSGGYAIGVVARLASDGPVLGYFFGPKRTSIPELDEISDLCRLDAIWTGQFGDLGLINGQWPVIGRLKTWHRDDWPVPPFIRVDDISGDAVMVILSDKDLTIVREEPCDPPLANRYPPDGLDGYGAVEITLTELCGR